jgi:hypothetical protein
MTEPDVLAMRREILDEVGSLLRDQLASEEWGRALVEVVRGEGGELTVAGIDVEDIVGDEARVDAAFQAGAAAPMLPVLAKATEALCGLSGVEPEDVRGGTFLRQPAGGFEWLPGLVHAPSRAFESAWDDCMARMHAKRRSLEERFGLGRFERYDVDTEAQTIVFSSGGRPSVRGRATVIGNYSRFARTWAWGGYNPHLAEPARKAAALLVDAVLERDIWELSMPVFSVDEATAWALAAFVCERAGDADGVYCSRAQSGLLFLLLRDLCSV